MSVSRPESNRHFHLMRVAGYRYLIDTGAVLRLTPGRRGWFCVLPQDGFIGGPGNHHAFALNLAVHDSGYCVTGHVLADYFDLSFGQFWLAFFLNEADLVVYEHPAPF